MLSSVLRSERADHSIHPVAFRNLAGGSGVKLTSYSQEVVLELVHMRLNNL
jgi:hypothetical protein